MGCVCRQQKQLHGIASSSIQSTQLTNFEAQCPSSSRYYDVHSEATQFCFVSNKVTKQQNYERKCYGIRVFKRKLLYASVLRFCFLCECWILSEYDIIRELKGRNEKWFARRQWTWVTRSQHVPLSNCVLCVCGEEDEIIKLLFTNKRIDVGLCFVRFEREIIVCLNNDIACCR